MVTFFLVNPTRKSSVISILVSFNGKKYRRSVGESIPVKLWNSSKKRAKVTADFSYGEIINDILSKKEAAALRAMTYFKEYYNPPTDDEFFKQLDKEYYKDDPTPKRDNDTVAPKPVLFVGYIDIYIARYAKVRSEITIKKYNTAINKLKDYEKETRRKLKFDDINIEFYNDFQHWFYKKGYADNYFGTVVKFIKQVYRESKIVDKLHGLDEIMHKDFISTSRESENVYLTESELLKIHHLDITPELILKHFPDLSPFRVQQKIKSMMLVRDRFLIGAYTGLRVSDFRRLNEMNIGKHIHLKTIKTGSNTVIPIHPVIQEILDKGFDPSVTVSDQKINVHIKEIAQLAGLNEKVLIHKHIGGGVKQEVSMKYELISTHTARRSFATNAYKAGVPTLAIMKITGHTKESTFLKYIKVSAEENADMLKSHPFFGGVKSAEPNAEPNYSNQG